MSLGVDAKRLSHKMMHTTLRIKCLRTDDKQSIGTGFIFSTKDDVPLIITCKHVIEKCISGEFVIAEGDEYNEPILSQGISVKLDDLANKWSLHPNQDIDLAFTPFKPIIEECFKQQKRPFFTSINSDTIPNHEEWKRFISIEDILMIGYPNGLFDNVNNIPFFMKGMTATHPNINYKGKKEFAIHMPIYPGSSGSPIFLLSERFYKKARSYDQGRDYAKLLGIAYKHFLYKAEGKIVPETDQTGIQVSSEIILDFGVAIRSTQINEFESMVEDMPNLHL
jgi:Trypsin-like peptidase domain